MYIKNDKNMVKDSLTQALVHFYHLLASWGKLEVLQKLFSNINPSQNHLEELFKQVVEIQNF